MLGCAIKGGEPGGDTSASVESQAASQRWAELSDEFDFLDTSKWWTVLPSWDGSPPGFFVADHSVVRDGILRQYVYKPDAMPAQAPDDRTYTTAVLKSRENFLYGSVTIRARSHSARVTSGFWFNHVSPENWNEIDVFELNHRWRNSGRLMPTNLHVFRIDGRDLEPRIFFQHTVRFGDSRAAPGLQHDNAFNTYRLDWRPDTLIMSLNGVPVRCVENVFFHQPMHVLLSASIQTPAGLPTQQELEQARPYEVDYIRTAAYDPASADSARECAGLEIERTPGDAPE